MEGSLMKSVGQGCKQVTIDPAAEEDGQSRRIWKTEAGPGLVKLKLVGERGEVLFGEELSLHVARRELPHPSDRPSMALSLALQEIGVNLINQNPEEILFFSISWVLTNVCMSWTTTSLDLAINSVQLDRLQREAEFPVIFAPKAMAPEKKQPFIQMGVAIAQTRAEAPVAVYRFFLLLIQEMDFKVEEELINRLIAYFSELGRETSQMGKEDKRLLVWGTGAWKQEDIDKAILADVKDYNLPPAAGANKMFFRLLQLQPLAINLSFRLSGETHKSNSSSTIPNPFSILGQMAGAAFGNLSNAPLRLNALTIENAYGDSATLTAPIISHYTKQGLGQVYKLVGSIEILGDPVALVGNLGEGVADFFYEPAQGLVSSPQEFGLGLARGTASLLKHTLTGVFGAASKITGSIGRGVATLSFDDQYTQERQRDMKIPPEHVGEGLYRGGKRLVFGVFRGVTGIFTDPYYGARRGGVGGFFKGVGVGLAGVVVKPVVGVVDFTSLTLQGIGNTATYFDPKYENSLFRPRRYIGPSKRVGLYNEKVSRMQQAAEDIAVLDDRKRHRKKEKSEEDYGQAEILLGAIQASPNASILATNFRLIVDIKEKFDKAEIKEQKLSKAERKDFCIAWTELSSAEVKKNVLTLVKESKKKLQLHRVLFQSMDGTSGDDAAASAAKIINTLDKKMDEIDNDAARLSIGPVDMGELPDTMEHKEGPVVLEPLSQAPDGEPAAVDSQGSMSIYYTPRSVAANLTRFGKSVNTSFSSSLV